MGVDSLMESRHVSAFRLVCEGNHCLRSALSSDSRRVGQGVRTSPARRLLGVEVDFQASDPRMGFCVRRSTLQPLHVSLPPWVLLLHLLSTQRTAAVTRGRRVRSTNCTSASVTWAGR
jgi:hypothetical protein